MKPDRQQATVTKVKLHDTVLAPVRVEASCGDSSNGMWHCARHPKERLFNQFEKDTHIGEGSHKLAWICHLHGAVPRVEVP